MPRVGSTNISGVEWRKEDSTLIIQFNNGSIYSYSGVPELVYQELLKAPSAGQFLNQAIKGIYPYQRLA